jgi:vacuolar-type H+-ATPase subunit H
MNRVLEAEREAAVAIAAAEAAAEATLAAARETRRRLLERARDRASRIHVRAQARLAAAIAELDARARGERGSHAALDTIAERAIDNLARRLTSTDHEPT